MVVLSLACAENQGTFFSGVCFTIIFNKLLKKYFLFKFKNDLGLSYFLPSLSWDPSSNAGM